MAQIPPILRNAAYVCLIVWYLQPCEGKGWNPNLRTLGAATHEIFVESLNNVCKFATLFPRVKAVE